MGNFKELKAAVDQQFKKLVELELFKTEVSKEELWDAYLGAFPERANPPYKERTEYDCQCCKQFIRACGSTVAIIDNKLVSIWDVTVPYPYQDVVNALAELVKSRAIRDTFLHIEKHLGTDYNHQLTESGETIKWQHFHYVLPSKFVKRGEDIASALSTTRSRKEVFKRALEEITLEALETVVELIDQKSIYRGEENKGVVELMLSHKQKYDALEDSEKDNYSWISSVAIRGASGIRNTAIGTLLVDISEGKPLDAAVGSFEAKVAPTNYKRPTALVTKGMIAKAQKKVEELGIGDSLFRRYAVTEDITINNVLFADRAVKKTMDVFDEIAEGIPDNKKNLEKVDEVDINTFMDSILPKAESVELLFENKLSNNLMSLIAPKEENAKPIFKWDNNFSWAYNGEVTDSIKERVKKAGGNVGGILRCSLAWFNYDDLDIHVVEPNGNHIYFSNKHSSTSGRLDVDMNVSGGGSRSAVENIVWTNKSKMKEGTYKVYINNYTPRETVDVGFDVEIEHDGVIHTFHHTKRVTKDVVVATFKYSKSGGIEFIKSLPSTQASREVWGVTTEKFQPVEMIMNSPNHWDGHTTGNKHWFFILKGCHNDKPARGFFNEFLKEDLTEHRKVFEILGSKMKVPMSNKQLSGIGLSSTQHNHVFCRVKGSFNRTIKIIL